jgi:hypothetical protein
MLWSSLDRSGVISDEEGASLRWRKEHEFFSWDRGRPARSF